jgi:hypothetical protein
MKAIGPTTTEEFYSQIFKVGEGEMAPFFPLYLSHQIVFKNHILLLK